MTGAKTLTPAGLSLDQLPQELLLNIIARLPEAELIASVPLVSKLFSQLMRLPNAFWNEVFYVRTSEGASKLNDGAAFCTWLRPRLAGLDRFCYAVDTLDLRGDESLPEMLIPILPSTLRQLYLQRVGTDGLCIANSRTSNSRWSGPAFTRAQDTAPHLAALTRLSNLQHLSVPLHSSLGSVGIDSLAALTALQHLELVWRYPHHVAGASLSSLVSLTNLELHSIQGICIDGLALLPQLQALHIHDCFHFSMANTMHATSLVSLSLDNVEFWQPASILLQMLHSMTQLQHLHMLGCHMAPPDGAALGFAWLLELPSLKSLNVSRTGDLQFEKQLQSINLGNQLTMLVFELPYGQDLDKAPGLVHLASWKHLTLSIKQRVRFFNPPMGLSSLYNLTMLEIVLPKDAVQMMDIIPLNGLCSSIETMRLYGHLKLFASGSLMQLAAQPWLRRVVLGSPSRHSRCCISSEGDTWLHCASFFHALLNRPLNSIPAVHLRPDLDLF